jgi:YD repeat-containing protein
MSKTVSNIEGGATRVTEHHSDGSSTDKTYDGYGKCVDITDHDSDGSSHSHEVAHGWFGPYAGNKKD